MGRIWAVAVNTVRQAVRMKVAVVFTVLLFILLPVLGSTISGDGTMKGRLQTFVSYGLSLTSLLLCMLTIVVSIYTLTSDIKYRQVFTVITKPIRRFQFVLGKLLGVLLLDFILLVLFSAVIYGIARYIPTHFHAEPEEVTQLENEFFTARASLQPVVPDVSREALEAYDALKKSGELIDPQGREAPRREVMKWLVQQKRLERQAAAVGQEILWEFEDVRPLDSEENIFIRFKFDAASAPVDSSIWGRWVVADYPHFRYGSEPEADIFDQPLTHSIGQVHEIYVPASVVPANGHLGVGFINLPANETAVIFPLEDGMELLYKADSFTGNFVRAAVLIFIRLVFLACLGTLAGAFLSFPVAILFALVVFLTAAFSGFVTESFDYLGENASGIYDYTLKPVISLLPQFDKYNPTKYLVPARLISWWSVLKATALMVGIKSVLVLIFAIIVFSRRELARITV